MTKHVFRIFKRPCRLLFILILLGLILLPITRSVWLPWMAEVLIRDDPPVPADAIVILMGSVIPRADRAAGLYRAKLAPKIYYMAAETSRMDYLGMTLSDSSLTSQYLPHIGIPLKDVEVITNGVATSTRDEALMLFKHFEKSPVKRIMVVTSWYHTRRAGWILDKVFDGSGIDIRMVPAPDRGTTPKDWWKQEGSFLSIFNEYLKWVYYLTHY